MNAIEYRHYVAGAEILASFDAFKAARKDTLERRLKWARQWNSKPVSMGNWLVGITGNDNPGPDWNPAKDKLDGSTWFRPNKRRNGGKEIDRAMSDFRMADWILPNFHAEIVSAPNVGKNSCYLCYHTWSHIGGVLVVGIPEQSKWTPPDDSRLLKMSEYYAMKEAADEKKKGI